MQKLRRFVRSLVPAPMGWLLIGLFFWNLIVFCGAKFLIHGRPHYDLTLPMDGAIPFLPWTVVIYLLAFVFWAVNFILACRYDRDRAWRFVTAVFLAEAVCFLFFLALPTTNTRPDIVGTTVWDWLMKLVYWIDTPENLFPSIHCLASWFCFIAVRGNRRIPLAYRIASLVFALMVAVSTLTTKQHVLMDVPSGIFLAELSWQLVGCTGLWRGVSRLFPGQKEKKNS